jgi:alpha-pyrone synthase
MVAAYLNRIATSVPNNDMHQRFVDWVPRMIKDECGCALFRRMASRAQIEHRYSVFKPHTEATGLDDEGFYCFGAFPDTGKRMAIYQREAFPLARRALDRLDLASLRHSLTHLIVTSCTGFYAPGLDLQIMEHYDLKASMERSIIGFLGCSAALNALKTARHIVRSEPSSKVLIVNLELCTLHLKETHDLEQILSFLLFADGCAASIVSSDPQGIELQSAYSTVIPQSGGQITWQIGGEGYDMVLSGQVPATIMTKLPSNLKAILNGRKQESIQHWAVHPGGRTILDAVQKSLGLSSEALRFSRDVLRRFGNLSSATIIFVLEAIMRPDVPAGNGCALAFGPGVCLESLLFHKESA